ncbi:protein of unknown function (plasmid) [Agreia sp. COWG]|nr:protein of unknown function [Agreia sp. COWG]
MKVIPTDPGRASRVLAEWEDIVESSFTPTKPNVALLDWAGESIVNFRLEETTYRARWSASGMDDGDQVLPRQKYELCLWPAIVYPDEILRVGSSRAAELHASRNS